MAEEKNCALAFCRGKKNSQETKMSVLVGDVSSIIPVRGEIFNGKIFNPDLFSISKMLLCGLETQNVVCAIHNSILGGRGEFEVGSLRKEAVD